MRDISGERSPLPEWMRHPQPTRTTLTWRIGQAMRRSAVWRGTVGWWWRFQARRRITQRFPKTTAVLAWLLSFTVIMVIVAIVYDLYADVL